MIAETDLAQESAVAGERVAGHPTSSHPSLAILSADELQELELCEIGITRGLKTFLEVGMFLMTIREHKLYRGRYCTFEQYLLERWDISVRQGQRLMIGAQIAHNLAEGVPGIPLVLPASENQVRPLAGLPPEEQRHAWAEAVRTAPNGRVTGRHVADVVARRRGLDNSGPILDPSAGNGPDPARHHAPGRPALPRDERLKEAAERVVEDMRELLELMGAADSAAGADLNVALETVERFQGHLERMDQLHAARI